ncbi:hyaluronan mediated motility receptor-like [Onthophagus taurus]|uniref:hyaluronan mediated motility receptor-like n=1 Tax=Onthophagus taurus TaxID=166361 RepID=UPI0039BE61CB
MSFPRAKLQRFNEIPTCSPSPADYNPIQKQRAWSVLSACSATTDRFSDNASVTSNGSSVFRTPNVVERKKPISIKMSTKLFNTTDKEMLEAKIVECSNKDAYIKDLAEQIEELKVQISDLRQQEDEIELEKTKYERNLMDVKGKQEEELEKLKHSHTEILNSLRIKLRKRSEEFTSLRDEYRNIKQEQQTTLEGLLKDLNQMGEEFNVKATEIYNAEIVSRENKIKQKEIEIEKITEDMKILEKNNNEEIKKIKELHAAEISKVEEEMLQIITSSEKLLDQLKSGHELELKEIEKKHTTEILKVKRDHSDLIKSLMDQKVADLQQLEEDYQLKKDQIEKETKQLIQQTETLWKNTLKEQEEKSNLTFKNLQQKSESKIIEIELEKNKLKQELADAKYELKELKELCITEEKFKLLQINYEKELEFLKSKRVDLEIQIEAVENELAQLVNTSRSYQVTLDKTRETVKAISKRLLNSDRDVELLKKELESREQICLNLEDECNRRLDEIENLNKINAELEEKQERFIAISNKEIEAIKKDYECKVKSYKNLIDETERNNKEFLSHRIKCLQESKEAFDLQQVLNNEAQNGIKTVNEKITNLEQVNINLKEENDELTCELKEKKGAVKELLVENESLDANLNTKMKENEILKRECLTNINEDSVEELKKQLFELQEVCDNLQNYCEYYKSKVEEYEKEIQDAKIIEKNYNDQTKKYEDLQKRFYQLQDEHNKQKQKIEEYDNLIGPYKEQLEAFEDERKQLISQKTDAEMKVAEISTKYAEILGHQNTKQKINHMVDLKTKIQCLEKANKDMEAKVRKQAKTIEQLKSDQTKYSKNKENNLNSPCDRYLSPLRDRN